MSAFVDPIVQPSEYQDMLLGLLGDADPAEVQSATPGKLRALLAEAGADLRTRPEPNEWSVLECVAHIVDAELVVGGRYRWILAHDRPDIVPYDQDLWVDRLHATTDEDAEELLSLFEPLREANLALWRRTPVAERARFGIHRERGPESYELTFSMLAGHDLFHLDQARRTLEQVRAGA
jgi:DinB family protein